MTATLSIPPVNLLQAAYERVATTNRVTQEFFDGNADRIASACESMATQFQNGGRLLVCGDDAQRSDVSHVVVEFMHPVVVGKRALPALPLPSIHGGYAQQALAVLGREHDVLLLLTAATPGNEIYELIAAARAASMQTIVLTGDDATCEGIADYQFAVPSDDRCIVQEVHEMLYHVLWELVHVFLDRGGVP